MKPGLALVVLSLLACQGAVQAADREALKAFELKVKAYHEEAVKRLESKQARLKELKDQLRALKTKGLNAVDASARKAIRVQMVPLQQELDSLTEQIAKMEIEGVRREIEFNQHRLRFLEERLAAMQAGRAAGKADKNTSNSAPGTP